MIQDKDLVTAER